MLGRMLYRLAYAVSLALLLSAAPVKAATLNSPVAISVVEPKAVEACRVTEAELVPSSQSCPGAGAGSPAPATGAPQQEFYHRLFILLRLLEAER